MIDDKNKIIISGLWDTLKRYDSYIATVNFKSGLITSLNIAIFGAVILKAKDIIDQHPDTKVAIAIALFLISALSAISIIWVIKSISPKLTAKKLTQTSEDSIFFFGSVSKNLTPEHYTIKVNNYSPEKFQNDLANQVYEVANILQLKFNLIKVASNITKLNLLIMIALSACLFFSNIGAEPCLH
ncbi:Pycsar system effector family protein [Rheinheimera pleomorphica]|uniref:Pycsar system effector family protein n=1 Tax=Rheinheimera pleomorphica TaxID=2703963 RepID=UPI00141F7BB2|nr:Pycsar system effector family protein [Rheinheimera pleomorphica]